MCEIEKTIARPAVYRRLGTRWERHGYELTAFLALAATLISYQKLA